ncbi:PEP-CTERM sorting domain-containing protein [Eleftheria terrae]|uniref:PEP-CTERM sorting domain-containing protein n=1 Tax=Eleftheria terrae TaxID=1597781 RepID=UPI00263AB218|nr:PEP-CTERM sorting domain-containing protein [Eleftheria terrae]WKB55393.1 DUF3466 family protein [Eleftheria terrae]
MSDRRLAAVSAACLLAWFSTTATAAPRYRLTALDGGTAATSAARGISADGKVTGSIGEAPSLAGFVYEGGQLQVFPSSGGQSYGADINSRGQVAGAYVDGSSFEAGQPARFEQGQPQTLGTYGWASAINERGQVAGTLSGQPGSHHRAFVHDEQGMRMLGVLGEAPDPYYTTSEARDLNDNGQVVGLSSTTSGDNHAFLYENGSMRDLGTLGGRWSVADGISNNGRITGSAALADDSYHAFLSDGGALHDLGTLGGGYSWGEAVNARGQVVGWSDVYNENLDRAFLFDDGQMVDLNSLLDATGRGWTLTAAYDINDRGQIVGTGLFNGSQHAFLLTPVPEPATIALSAAGLGLLALRRRTRRPATA